MKYLILVILLCLGCSSFEKKESQKYSIEATVMNAEDSTQVFVYDTENQIYLDSTMIVNHAFSLTGKIGDPVPILITLFKGNTVINIPAWLDNKKFSFNIDFFKLKNNQENYLKGENIISSDINRYFIKYMTQMDSITHLEQKEIARLKSTKNDLSDAYNKYGLIYLQKAVGIAFKEPNNYISISKMVDLEHSISKDSVRLYYSILNLKFRNSKKGKQLKNFIDAPILVEGEPIIDFSAKDVNGEMHQLSNYTRGVVLLDFWYSLCGPCRLGNVNELPQIVNTYKNKDFKLISFSVETNQTLWINAVKKDKMTWLNLSDLKGTNSEVAIKYNLKFFPTFFIIKNGIVLSRIEGDIDKVKKELEKIFGEK